MTTASITEPVTTAQTFTFEHALLRAASLYEGHIDHGRLTKAVEIARNGGITWHDDGTATVQGRTQSHHVNGTCDCDDAKFHGQYCTHAMAVALATMAYNTLTAHQPPPSTEPPAPWQCSQAPSSCTVKWHSGGVELMLTLRDAEDEALFERMRTVLPKIQARVEYERAREKAEREQRNAEREQRDAERQENDGATTATTSAPASSVNAEHYCDYHDVPLKKHSKGHQSWYSHYDADTKTWCRGQ